MQQQPRVSKRALVSSASANAASTNAGLPLAKRGKGKDGVRKPLTPEEFLKQNSNYTVVKNLPSDFAKLGTATEKSHELLIFFLALLDTLHDMAQGRLSYVWGETSPFAKLITNKVLGSLFAVLVGLYFVKKAK